MHFKEGKEVKKGDLLLTIDPRPYQAEYDLADAQYQRTQSQADLAKNDAERAKRSENVSRRVDCQKKRPSRAGRQLQTRTTWKNRRSAPRDSATTLVAPSPITFVNTCHMLSLRSFL